jgi:hypothetical protein
MKISHIALLGLLLAGRPVPQQANGSLEGYVLQVGTDAPVGKATVELRRLSEDTAISTTTDDQGRFFFPELPAGQYRMAAMRDGYTKMEYGQRRPGGSPSPLTLTAGQRMTGIRVALTPGGSVSGRVTDRGEPSSLTDVFALKATFIEGQLTLNPVLSAKTNDLGEYHIFWLPPGRYYIGTMVWDTAAAGTYPIFVNPDSTENAFYPQRRNIRFVMNKSLASGVKESEAHPFMYHPGTPDPERATAIDVKPGANLRGIDVKADALPAWHIRGRVTGLPQQNPNGQQVPPALAIFPMTASFARNTMPTQINSDGTFDISRVNPGRYVLSARVPGANATARVAVEVLNRDLDVVINLTPGAQITGRIVVDRPAAGGAPTVPMSDLRVILRPDPLVPGSQVYSAIPADDGLFTIPSGNGNPLGLIAGRAQGGRGGGPGGGGGAPLGVPIGDYRVLVAPILQAPTQPGSASAEMPPALRSVYVKRIGFGESDALNSPLRLRGEAQDPLVITLGMQLGSIEGRVLDGRQQPVTNGTVVLIPNSSLRFKVDHRFATTDSAGRFQIDNLPPGDYDAFAWEDIERGAWQDAGFMRDFEGRGQPIHIDEGSRVAADLTPLPLS